MKDSTDLFSRTEFSIHDYYEVYERKKGRKLFRDASSQVLKNLSYHWKFIIEVITASREFPFQMAAILKLASADRAKILGDKTFWVREGSRYGWISSDKEEMICKVKRFNEEFILKCLQFINTLDNDGLDEVKNSLKDAFTVKIDTETIKIFLQNIIDKAAIIKENPIGDRFIQDRLEFTEDKKYYGITTSVLFKEREKWMKANPTYPISSYSLIQFGRIVTIFKTWETEQSRSNIKHHLGIKFKPV